jgi:glucosamine kinase
MAYYLGIDGGGTKTAALIIDESGAERGRGQGGPGNVATHDDAMLTHSLRDALEGACQTAKLPRNTRFAAVCAGIAGYSAAPRRDAFERILRAQVDAESYRIEPDYVIAYWGATHGEPGIIVIAGTGAVSYGRNAEGESAKEDGLGFLLGDRGSGFNLGLHVLRYTLEQMQAGKSDALTEAVIAHTGATKIGEIIQWLYGNFSPARVAELAPIVGALAEQGDPAARAHVSEMAMRLRHAVRQIRHTLWLPRDTPIYPLGGLWQLGDFLRAEFIEPTWHAGGLSAGREEALPGGRFNLAPPRSSAVYGAALLATAG